MRLTVKARPAAAPRRRPLATVILTLSALAIALLGAELLLRALSIAQYSLDDRILFYSFPAFVGDSQHGVRHAPNTTIRSVAVYSDQIDYDVTRHSNNLGFYDDFDYRRPPPGVRSVVFIGDSFTAGSGGINWVARLRAQMPPGANVAVFNLGVGGTGVRHFSHVLQSFRDAIGFDEVNVVVISNDFLRPLWHHVQAEQGLWFCLEGEADGDCTAARAPFLRRFELDEDPNSIVARARQIYAQNRQLTHTAALPYQRLHLYTLLCDALSDYLPDSSSARICPHLRVHYYPQYSKDAAYEDSIAQLRDLVARYPGVHFRLWHVPEKGEAILGHYALDPEPDLAGTLIDYIPLLPECHWQRGDYHKHDGHWNERGYEKLVDCIRQRLPAPLGVAAAR